MNPRLNYYQASQETIDGLSQVSTQLAKEFSNPKLKALVELRVSQLNGCAYCMDLHSHELRELGEKQQRLDCLPAWREVPFYDARERAALAWAESVTLVSQTHVPDEVFAEASRQFTGQQLVQLTVIVGLMNTWNRISISFRNAPKERSAG